MFFYIVDKISETNDSFREMTADEIINGKVGFFFFFLHCTTEVDEII